MSLEPGAGRQCFEATLNETDIRVRAKIEIDKRGNGKLVAVRLWA